MVWDKNVEVLFDVQLGHMCKEHVAHTHYKFVISAAE